MRSITKFLAAATLVAMSASSFALPVHWTSGLSAVKITYMPNNSGPGAGLVQLTGTGSTCGFGPISGLMVLNATDSASGDDARAVYNMLVQTKNAGGIVTLTYDNSDPSCPITGITR